MASDTMPSSSWKSPYPVVIQGPGASLIQWRHDLLCDPALSLAQTPPSALSLGCSGQVSFLGPTAELFSLLWGTLQHQVGWETAEPHKSGRLFPPLSGRWACDLRLVNQIPPQASLQNTQGAN